MLVAADRVFLLVKSVRVVFRKLLVGAIGESGARLAVAMKGRDGGATQCENWTLPKGKRQDAGARQEIGER